MSAALLAALVLLIAGAGSASADAGSLEVSEYRKDFDVSAKQAEEVLETQAKAAETGLVENLEAGLDEDFGGIWFKPESGEYVVALASDAAAPAVGREMATTELAEDYRTRVVRYSWEELEAAQSELDKKLAEFFGAGLVYTSLDPRTNSAVLHVAAEASEKDRAILGQIAGEVGDEVELRVGADDRFEISSNACSPISWVPNCGTPFRGGVGITYLQHEETPSCTAGFRAIGVNGKRYVITAGHCVIKDLYNPDLNDPWTQWKAWDEQVIKGSLNQFGEAKYLGQVEQLSPFPTYDWAKIDATGTAWDTWNTPQGWPSTVAYWQEGQGKPAIDEEYDINWEAKSVIGQTVCHSGMKTGTTCGLVVDTNVSTEREAGMGYGLVKVKGTCQDSGDSGGPWFFANTAYGIHLATDNGMGGICEGHAFYEEITRASEALGVWVTKSSKVTTTATALNGNPGWATVKGEVKVPSGATINGKVDIKLFKWENNDWAEKATLKEVPVSNNKYEYKNWNGVGPGQWLAKAVFPAQGGYEESSSNATAEGSFIVKDGYRIRNKNSDKCLDVKEVSKENGAAMHQWECLNPTTSQNQVFTLVPDEGSYVKLVARHSGRCVDVTGAGAGDGALLQQWTCSSGAQQKWQATPVETAGGIEYIKLVAKHSAKCMDVPSGSKADGTVIQQWGCSGVNQQKWFLQSVDSAPIPTETFLTVPEGERLNGQPGFVNAHGYVKSGGYSTAGQTVTINYEKLEGTWKLKTTAKPTLNSEGYYEHKFMELGPGEWRMKTEYSGAGNLAGSASPGYVGFTLGSGYRLQVRHSTKCLNLWGNSSANGTPLVQWDCLANPNPGDGETFTLVPKENGSYFNIKINSTGKCLDVSGAETGNGAKVQEWACFTAPLASNQLWQVIPIAGQSPWVAFKAKHSGRCMDVEGVSQANGAKIHQWDCNWTGNQQWKFLPVS